MMLARAVSEDGDVWRRDANCLTHETDEFFPGAHDPAAIRAALAVCADCTVRTECLDYAVRNHEWLGIWGGKSERARRRMRGSHQTGAPTLLRSRVVALYWQGLKPAEIAARLGISRQQVYWHVANDKAADEKARGE